MLCIEHRLKKLPGFRLKCVVMVAMAFLMAAGAFTPGFAQDLPEIRSISPVPDLAPYKGARKYYRTGRIDRISKDAIVVNDKYFEFTTGEDGELSFYSEDDETEITFSYFRLGHRVGVVLDGIGGLRELWLLKDQGQ